jgi:AAA+ superfamily predicted ATPase
MDPFQPLRDALGVSPNNVPLRTHLADSLAQAGRADDAEAVLKDGLTRTPGEPAYQLALAKLYLQSGKTSAGIVICEGLLRGDHAAKAGVLLAKLLLREGKADRAVSAYRAAIDTDPDVAEEALAAQLGIHAADDDEVIDGRVRIASGPIFDDDDVPGEIERPKIKFDDVGGMESVKEEIRLKIIYPLAHADLYKAYGKSIGGGLLMYGPPGCGKTHLARATAGEVKAGFIAVGLHDVLDMWIGSSERNLHQIFEQARRNSPCVLFFDEVDALAASRTDFRTSASRHVINQFLHELDGATASNDGVLVIAATNAPWHMDSAFRRPGRFDRILFVPPPDAAARAAILRLHLAGKPQGNIDFDAVAQAAGEFSGADLKGVIDRAVEAKLKEAMRTGVPAPLSTKDLTAAVRTVRPSTREWLADARNYAMYANEGGQYDDLAKYLKVR